ncbi:alpha-D-ribose 1-methylphosphonate 5-triphosphate diphosphatase [Geomicrobium halophilum]|uniref:Alpha-D-ribose 1-methylphosphonate 5-triphosphate diphosphatase n=1 Tax=Geomicrobium halophilum TaxID=549000 RepID=A0A841PM43_9BACL|nr:alpha-D-ribose 1-methylphosphonate 5-triphosphate diphosphatase [Geomicrobium halophilum]MBB6449917.1 alpha-D-ribose 1-methylphosphonate 5-triphosphate diphosphatase [Geomicrobium halophilum]
MHTGSRRIINGNIVTPTEVLIGGSIEMENGVITEILPHSRVRSLVPDDIDARNNWIIPGIIDTHSDAIEKEIQPRPSSLFAPKQAFMELEKKLVFQGITTMYHSLSLREHKSGKQRSNETVVNLLEDINEMKQHSRLINHKTHIRFEVTNVKAIPIVREWLELCKMDQLSFTDHTPGQGQYRNGKELKDYIMYTQQMTEQEAVQWMDMYLELERIDHRHLREIADIARRQNIPLSSHDDDTLEKIDTAKRWHASISEFPITLDIAQAAKEAGLYVVMGAPNIILGGSHNNNLSALEALKSGAVDVLCSDYYPPAMLQAAFYLYKHGFLSIPESINLISYNPAKALSIESTGALKPGLDADILIVNDNSVYPAVERTILKGFTVGQLTYQPTKQPTKG